MNGFLQKLLLFEEFEFQTKLPKKIILKKIASFADPRYTDYFGKVSDDGFFIVQKNLKSSTGGHIDNSFAPVAKAKITENDGVSTVSMVIRMNTIVSILFAPFYLAAMLSVVLFPFVLILLYFAFMKPAKELKEAIVSLLIEDDI